MGSITRTFANNITTSGKFDATDLTGTLPAANIANASCTNITAVPSLTATSTVSSDPPSPDAGQMWYNTTTKQLKGYIAGAGSWATAANMNTSRYSGAAAGATGTAALVFGGSIGPASTDTVNTETWNGSAWTEVANLNLARNQFGGFGTSTSAVAIGGNKNPGAANETEIWNGSGWTEVGNLNSARRLMPGAGATSTAGIVFGGLGPPTYAITESWNGSSWTEVGDLNAARYQVGGFGTSTAALAFGGDDTPDNTVTESWNGSSWTEVNDMNTGVKDMAGAGYNSNTSGLKFGGANDSGTTANTEEWNGTSWVEVNNLNSGRNGVGGAGTKSSALVFGADPSATTAEEWSVANATTVLGAS